MTTSYVKAIICTALGALGGLFTSMFGGWSEDMITLIIFMGVDFAMGLAIAGIFCRSSKSATGALDSKAGWQGLCRKGVTLLFVLVAHRLDLALGLDYIRTTAIIGFIVNEAISIIENAGIMGVPLPPIIKKGIEILRDKSEGGDKDE